MPCVSHSCPDSGPATASSASATPAPLNISPPPPPSATALPPVAQPAPAPTTFASLPPATPVSPPAPTATPSVTPVASPLSPPVPIQPPPAPISIPPPPPLVTPTAAVPAPSSPMVTPPSPVATPVATPTRTPNPTAVQDANAGRYHPPPPPPTPTAPAPAPTAPAVATPTLTPRVPSISPIASSPLPSAAPGPYSCSNNATLVEVTCTYQGCDYHLDGSLVNNLTSAIRSSQCVTLNLTSTSLAVCNGCTIVDSTTLNAISSGNCTAVCANEPSLPCQAVAPGPAPASAPIAAPAPAPVATPTAVPATPPVPAATPATIPNVSIPTPLVCADNTPPSSYVCNTTYNYTPVQLNYTISVLESTPCHVVNLSTSTQPAGVYKCGDLVISKGAHDSIIAGLCVPQCGANAPGPAVSASPSPLPVSPAASPVVTAVPVGTPPGSPVSTASPSPSVVASPGVTPVASPGMLLCQLPLLSLAFVSHLCSHSHSCLACLQHLSRPRCASGFMRQPSTS